MKPIAVSPSKPVEGTSVVYGADQPEYLPLPAWRRDHRVITRWRLSWRERIAAVLGRSLYMSPVDDRPLSSARCPCNLTPEQVRADLIEGSKP